MEQVERARRFEALGRCHVLFEAELGPESLARAVAEVLSGAEPIMPSMDLAGICNSADWLEARM
jgi:predicted glycosyltransferase